MGNSVAPTVETLNPPNSVMMPSGGMRMSGIVHLTPKPRHSGRVLRFIVAHLNHPSSFSTGTL